MTLRLFIMSLLLPVLIQAQSDSIRYFSNQLKKKDLSDSVRAHYSLKLSDQYLDTDAPQSVHHARNAIAFSSKTNSKTLLSASQQNAASAYLNWGKADSSLQYATQSLALARDIQN